MEPHVIIESNIPYADGIFGSSACVSRLAPAGFTPKAVADADAIITRTRTRCDAALLSGSRCRIVASATIGLDHVDTEWCRAAGIEVANAPGCNAPAVAQYVLASVIAAYGMDLRGLTLGVVGVGNVGRIVARWAEGLGMRVLCCDPPRAEAEGADGFCDMSLIAREADIVTFHTPLTHMGPHPTFHLLGQEFINLLQRRPMVINAARGAVADTEALVSAIDSGRISRAAIDCWEGEPQIDRRLLDKAFIATPHIAGYSREGKIRATAMAAEAVARTLGLPAPTLEVALPGPVPATVTAESIVESYDPLADTDVLRAYSDSLPASFESLRNHYPLRPEPR